MGMGFREWVEGAHLNPPVNFRSLTHTRKHAAACVCWNKCYMSGGHDVHEI